MDSATPLFQPLPGLPGEGPEPLQFSSTGMGTHSEGFVIEFHPSGKMPWVGNFQPGLSAFSKALLHPDGRSVIVISGGQAYQVDPSSRALLGEFGGTICGCIAVADRSMLLLADDIRLRALNPAGLAWQTERISWDGIRGLAVAGDDVSGDAYDPMTNTWKAFSVRLDSGKVTGGSYADGTITKAVQPIAKAARRTWFLLLIPAVAAMIAVLLFLSQRGFGGGHGDFDRAIGVLGLPGILLLEHMPLLVQLPDILLVVIIPALLNCLFWSGIVLALGAVLRRND